MAKSTKASKQPVSDTETSLTRQLGGAPLALAFLWPAILVVGGYVMWHRWGVEHVGRRFNRVETSKIELTDRPHFIPADLDLTAEVLNTTSLGDLSLLDPQVSARIAQAYATHPWVDQVLAVRVQAGGGIEVQVRYRAPVAMVRHISQHPDVQGWAYYPVDREGIVLPPYGFTRADAESYLVIDIPDVSPRGTPGFSCGDQRVIAAAALASILAPARAELGIAAIEQHAADDPNNRILAFMLRTTSGKRIVWGSAPGQERIGEPSPQAKLRVLLQVPPEGTDLRIVGRSTGRP